MYNTLSYIGEKFNNSGILWAVGASIMLSQLGLADKPKDIDILVDIKDIDKADEILKGIGEKKPVKETNAYSTRYFYEYMVNGFDLDVMSGLRINHQQGIFEYIFDQNSVSEIKSINGADIPLASLEDWYVIYQLIPGREEKVKRIEEHILENGVKKSLLLERALTGNLPDEVRERIENVLKLTINKEI